MEQGGEAGAGFSHSADWGWWGRRAGPEGSEPLGVNTFRWGGGEGTDKQRSPNT